jgi:HPt (histidine-containing phosphotransfer) domain-containing protein
MADNFDLKKFLKESKALENLNPSIKSINEGEAAYEYEKGEEAEKKKMTKEVMKKQIKDMIVAELDLDINKSADSSDYRSLSEEDEELEEAKKKDEEFIEDVEVTDTEMEDAPAEDEMPAEDAPETTGGIEDIAADMKGTEADLMDNLMKAFQIAKGMNNEKLETQVGNTLKFFVSEYIGGGEQ